MGNSIKRFYEEKYLSIREIERSSKEYAIHAVPRGSKLKVLDIGCGTGVNSQKIVSMGHVVEGVDLSEEAIKRYRDLGFTGHCLDIERGSFLSSDSYDVVFCSEVIEHLTVPAVVLNDFYRILKPGGVLILSTPNSAFWVYRLAACFGYTVGELQHPMHFRFFSRRSLVKVVRDAGFEIIRFFGRNMYCILPDPRSDVFRKIFLLFGFRREQRFTTGKDFWHLSHRSGRWNGLFADTLIVVARKPLGA